MTLQWKTLEKFARAKKLPYAAVRRASMRDKWLEDRTEIEQKANEKVKEGTAESIAQKVRRVKDENFKASTTIMAAGLKRATEKGINSPEQAVKIGMEGRLQSLDQATEIFKLEVELTEEDRAEAHAIGLRLAKLAKKAQ